MKFLVIGGRLDGQWLTLREMRKHKGEYEKMPIRAPFYPKGYGFTVFKPKELNAPDVVMLLLDGYRQAVTHG
jgi:hypothetical protein